MFEEIKAHFYKQHKIMSKRPGEIAWIAIYPFIALLSLGILAFFLITSGAPLDSMVYVLVGVVSWNFYDISQRAVTYGITFDIWSDSLKHAFTGTSKLRHFIAGNALFGLFSSVVAFVLVAVVAQIIFGFSFWNAGIFLPINLFFVFLFATGIGLIINALMVSKGEKYMSLIWVGTGVIMIFSGVYYPVNVLPGAVGFISNILPSTHSIISIRSALDGSVGLAMQEFLIGAGIAVVFFIMGVLIFRYGVKKGKENGVITNH